MKAKIKEIKLVKAVKIHIPVGENSGQVPHKLLI